MDDIKWPPEFWLDSGNWDGALVPKDRWVILEYEYGEKGPGYPCVGRWNPKTELLGDQPLVYEFEVVDPFEGITFWPASRVSRWRELPE